MLKSFLFLIVLSLAVIFGIYQERASGPFDPILCRLTLRRQFCPTPVLTGYVNPKYQTLADQFHLQFYRGESLGAQLNVWHEGENVLNLVGAYNQPNYTEDSLQIVFSSTKVMSPLVIGLLVDRGLLNFTDPISKHWPEFGQNGKSAVTIEDLLKHESGLAYFDNPISNETIYALDPKRALKTIIETATPYFPEGSSKRVYHAQTRGWIENELVKIVDPQHRDIGEIFQEEIAKPLGVEFYIGRFPPELYKRLVRNTHPPILFRLINIFLPYFGGYLGDARMSKLYDLLFDKTSVPFKSLYCRENWDFKVDVSAFTELQELTFVSPSVNGVTNAKSMGKILQMLAQKGQLEGKRYFSEETWNQMISNPTTQFDHVLQANTTFTRGGWSKGLIPFAKGDLYGWVGMGGSYAMFSPETKVSFAYAMNGMASAILGDPRSKRVILSLADLINSS